MWGLGRGKGGDQSDADDDCGGQGGAEAAAQGLWGSVGSVEEQGRGAKRTMTAEDREALKQQQGVGRCGEVWGLFRGKGGDPSNDSSITRFGQIWGKVWGCEYASESGVRLGGARQIYASIATPGLRNLDLALTVGSYFVRHSGHTSPPGNTAGAYDRGAAAAGKAAAVTDRGAGPRD